MHGCQHTLSTQPHQQTAPHAAPTVAHATAASVVVPSPVPETAPGLSTAQATRSEMAPAAKPLEAQTPPNPAETSDKFRSKQAKISSGNTQQEKPPQPPSFQAVMDSELAMHEAHKQVPNQPLTWADRVRGAPANVNSPPQPVVTPTSAVPNGHRSQQQQPRPKSGQPREPREHRPSRPPFNKEGAENNATRSGPPRGGFRGNGRSRGNGLAPLRGLSSFNSLAALAFGSSFFRLGLFRWTWPRRSTWFVAPSWWFRWSTDNTTSTSRSNSCVIR